MKKLYFAISLAIITLGVMFFVSSCGPEPSFDETLLIGKWRRTSTIDSRRYEYYRYNADSSGVTWDEGDDVSEDEAQPFTWTLSGSTLTLVHKMENGAVVPKSYTLTSLTAASLAYKDSYGTVFAFSKTN